MLPLPMMNENCSCCSQHVTDVAEGAETCPAGALRLKAESCWLEMKLKLKLLLRRHAALSLMLELLMRLMSSMS